MSKRNFNPPVGGPPANETSVSGKREKEFEERVLEVNRVSRTVKGGKRLRFRVLVIAGNRNGKVGMGLGKAQEVSQAVGKAAAQAKKHLIAVPMINGTIPSEINTFYGSTRIILKPASPGTSIIAGGAVRAILELAGIKNILSKIIGSTNKINTATATILALKKISKAQTIGDRITKLKAESRVSAKDIKQIVSREKKTAKKKLLSSKKAKKK